MIKIKNMEQYDEIYCIGMHLNTHQLIMKKSHYARDYDYDLTNNILFYMEYEKEKSIPVLELYEEV